MPISHSKPLPANMVGATAGTAGQGGLVPQPNAGQQGLFLRGDGTFAAPAGGGSAKINVNNDTADINAYKIAMVRWTNVGSLFEFYNDSYIGLRINGTQLELFNKGSFSNIAGRGFANSSLGSAASLVANSGGLVSGYFSISANTWGLMVSAGISSDWDDQFDISFHAIGAPVRYRVSGDSISGSTALLCVERFNYANIPANTMITL